MPSLTPPTESKEKLRRFRLTFVSSRDFTILERRDLVNEVKQCSYNPAILFHLVYTTHTCTRLAPLSTVHGVSRTYTHT